MMIKLITVALAVVGAFLFLGTQDYKERQQQEKQYKEMVCNGYWPDYKKVKPTCEVK
jgi:hypothetical protein